MPTSTEIANERVVFHNCAVLDAEKGELVQGQNILIAHGRIEKVSLEPIDGSTIQSINMNGMVVMPVLIDCHVHCVASSLNLGKNASLPNVFATLKSIPILEGMLYRGFTSVRDAGGADWSLTEATRTGLLRGPRIF